MQHFPKGKRLIFHECISVFPGLGHNQEGESSQLLTCVISPPCIQLIFLIFTFFHCWFVAGGSISLGVNSMCITDRLV